MRLFVRQSRGGNWDNLSQDTPENLQFPADVLADVLYGGETEISVWEVDALDSPEIGYVVAALHSSSAPDLSDMTFRVISEWLVNKLNLRMETTIGTSLDDKLNHAGKHWIIKVPTVGDAMRLAKGFKERQAKSFGKADVMRLFAVSLQEKRISTDKVSMGLWKKLFKGDYLGVVAEQQRTSHDPS